MKYKYCLWCGSEVKRSANFCNCMSCGRKFFINSSPTASAIPIKENKILLAKRAINPHKGKYDFIGGFLNRDEDPKKGVVRETKEETGLDVKVIRIFNIYMDKYKYQGELMDTLNIYYIVEIIGGKEKAQDDVASLRWFPIDKLPTNMAFKHNQQIKKDLTKEIK